MRSPVAALALAVLATAAAPRVADACHCLEDGPGVTVPGGDVVPPNPTIYVFVPPRLDGRLERGGAVIGAHSTARIVARSPAYTVWRHDVTRADGTFELDLPTYDTITYTVGSPPPNEASVAGIELTRQPSSCYTHVAIDLEITGTAVAYRFAWSDGTSTIVPAFRSAYAPTGGTSLGLVGCNGGRWNVTGLDASRDVVMFALFADGSEHKLGSSTAKLSDNGVRAPVELVGATLAPPEASPPRPPIVVVEETAWWRHALAASLGVTAVGLAAGAVALALARRRRHHVERITAR